MTETPLGPGREFDVIRRILGGRGGATGPSTDRSATGAASDVSERVALAAGDDCALIRADGAFLAVAVDVMVEGTHFRLEWGDPAAVGGRAVRAALSDLAAMAAEPIGVLAAIVVPEDAAAELAERIGRGAGAAGRECGAGLIGGDLARGGDRVVVDVAVVGSTSRPLRRDGVRPGDELWVTGSLGAAAAAVGAWTRGAEPAEELIERFWRPRPRLREAIWLAERGATAAIDLSDGLIADARHLSAASGVGIEIDAAVVPVAAGCERSLGLSGGEDFELLVAVPAGILGDGTAGFERGFGVSLTRIGRAVVGSGVRVFEGAAEIEVPVAGFDHFG